MLVLANNGISTGERPSELLGGVQDEMGIDVEYAWAHGLADFQLIPSSVICFYTSVFCL